MNANLFLAGPAAAYAPPMTTQIPATIPVDGHLRRAHRALLARRHREALACFDRALLDDPRHRVARAGRAVCLAELGDEETAALELASSLEGTEGAQTALRLAEASLQRGDRALAMKLVAIAATASPAVARRGLEAPTFLGLRDHPLAIAVEG